MSWFIIPIIVIIGRPSGKIGDLFPHIRSTASEELKSFGGEIKDTLVSIGLKMFQPPETVLPDVVGG